MFADGRPIAWAATICHHTDVGGRVPGSNASDSTEIYDRNVRLPGRVMGDLRAQLAACKIAARGLAEQPKAHIRSGRAQPWRLAWGWIGRRGGHSGGEDGPYL